MMIKKTKQNKTGQALHQMTLRQVKGKESLLEANATAQMSDDAEST